MGLSSDPCAGSRVDGPVNATLRGRDVGHLLAAFPSCPQMTTTEMCSGSLLCRAPHERAHRLD